MNLLLKISSIIRYKKIGIIVAVRKNSELDISYYQMSKSGSSVDISYSHAGLRSLDEIEFLVKKYPTILTIQGTGIVQRMLPGSNSDIKQNIPNINAEEYLIEIEETNENDKLVALFRRDQIDSILCESTINHFPIHDISIGFTQVCKYLNFFSKETISFEIDGNTLILFENKIQELQKNKTSGNAEYFFAGKNRNSHEIIALSAGLNYFTSKRWNTFQIINIEEKIKEYTASRLYSFILYYLGTTLFLLLLINFLIFDFYQKKYEKLEIESGDMVMVQNEINQLQSELNAKKQFIQQNNVPENFAFAFYADRLAAFADQGIEFSELSVCPVIGKVKEDKTIAFQSKILQLKGSAPSPTSYSVFLENIKGSQWVKKLNKQVYMFNNETEKSDFEIEIELNYAVD